MNKKLFSFVAVFTVSMVAIYAQSGSTGMQGANAINTATQTITQYFEPITKLMYAVSAILGLVGGIKVYSKWNAGDPDTTKAAASWFGSCIFLVVVASVLRAFFIS